VAADDKRRPDDDEKAAAEVAKHERRTLAGSYFDRALSELRASGSADALYPDHGSGLRLTPSRGALGRRIAGDRRREATRSAVLFAMLAAEAYANQYLQIHLSGEEFEAADRLPTFEKFILGPRLVGGAVLLERGREPAQTLRKLLRQRTVLVHPKLAPAGSDGPEYTPLEAAQFIVAVAESAGWLIANSDPRPGFDMKAMAVDQDREFILEFARKATERLPEPTDPPAPNLIIAIWEKAIEEQANARGVSLPDTGSD
jgi:hypothetical protein